MGGARKMLIGITGGIAAYKIPLLVRLLRKNGCEVKTVVTDAAKTLVGVDALRTLSGNPVYHNNADNYDMDHIRLSEWADLFVVCPATANTIAKMACGIADNLLTTLALSIPEEKIVVAPAMNCEMWRNGATRRNIDILKDRGIDVLPVGEGELACGVSGPGRMLEIDLIYEHIVNNERIKETLRGEVSPSLQPTATRSFSAAPSAGGSAPRNAPGKTIVGTNCLLDGKTVLISSGPTEENIDPVRVITNKSSGKMGAALALAALNMGAEVTVVSGPASVSLPDGAKVINVRTACEMEREMACRFGSADICIMAAAVSDYRPVNPSDSKLQRLEKENIVIELTPNPDILAKLGSSKTSKQFVVGFALESGDEDVARAEGKMRRKNCDMMVFNKAAVSLGGDDTGITILYADGGRESFEVMGKTAAAEVILAKIAERVTHE